VKSLFTAVARFLEDRPTVTTSLTARKRGKLQISEGLAEEEPPPPEPERPPPRGGKRGKKQKIILLST
jgi:hypothetical protein